MDIDMIGSMSVRNLAHNSDYPNNALFPFLVSVLGNSLLHGGAQVLGPWGIGLNLSNQRGWVPFNTDVIPAGFTQTLRELHEGHIHVQW
jgi:hypothetical protein